MADAETNKTTTTTQPAGATGGGGGTAAGQGATGPQTSADAATRSVALAAQTDTVKKEKPRFFVDGQAVEKDVYLKAAEAAGWDPAMLQERNFFPAITTKK